MSSERIDEGYLGMGVIGNVGDRSRNDAVEVDGDVKADGWPVSITRVDCVPILSHSI